MRTKEDIQFWLFVFCIADNLNQHLRKPLPKIIERTIARKFISADRLSTALFNIAYGDPVADELPPTEEEEWLKEIQKNAISMYTKGGLIFKVFQFGPNIKKKRCLITPLSIFF